MPEKDTENNAYWDQVIAYRMSMTIVKELLEKGIISKEDHKVISKKLAEKYGLDNDSIFEDDI